MELRMTEFFTNWGTTCATYPIPVMVLSVAFAVGLTTGVSWLQVETDPIELWASSTSRARVEKDYYDQTFRPFYRTEQIIIHARNIESVSNFLATGQLARSSAIIRVCNANISVGLTS